MGSSAPFASFQVCLSFYTAVHFVGRPLRRRRRQPWVGPTRRPNGHGSAPRAPGVGRHRSGGSGGAAGTDSVAAAAPAPCPLGCRRSCHMCCYSVTPLQQPPPPTHALIDPSRHAGLPDGCYAAPAPGAAAGCCCLGGGGRPGLCGAGAGCDAVRPGTLGAWRSWRHHESTVDRSGAADPA